MNDPMPVKKGLTLAWSIGIGVVFLGITSVVLMPATKSARAAIRGQDRWQAINFWRGSISGIGGANHAPSPTSSTTPMP